MGVGVQLKTTTLTYGMDGGEGIPHMGEPDGESI
jgi:hypothetical protein